MPTLRLGDIDCYYRLEGPDEAPVVMLSHALGLDHGLWDAQAADLRGHLRVLRYDTRGHGATTATAGDYSDCSIDRLGRDALALADALAIERFAFCGLSLGGAIGLWLAANAPERVTHLIVANSSARLTDPSVMETRRRLVSEGGLAAVVPAVLPRFFSPRALAANGPEVAWARRTLLASNPDGYIGCCAALRDMDLTPLLSRIRVPATVIAGDLDAAMPWSEHSGPLVQSIPGATAVHLDAAHVSNLERPRAFTAALLETLLPTRPSGEAVRRRVLGDPHVDRAMASTTPFTREFQDLISQYAWGSIWSRPGLDHRTRRLLVLAITAALGRWDEFRLHVRAGLDRELEEPDLKEVLLQTAIYAGVPAANHAFSVAREALDREGGG